MSSRFQFELGRALREAGQAIDRIGLRSIEKPIFKEAFSRHRPVMNLFDKHPWKSPDAFVAPSASVIGNVDININSSVMYGAVVRGDLSKVDIGAYTSVGDRAVIHTSETVEGSPEANTVIGDYVQIGAGALLQSCTVQTGAKVGAGAIVMEGALVEADAEVAAGAVVHPGRRIPSGELWAGNPATKVRDLTATEKSQHKPDAEAAASLAQEHSHQFLPHSSAYQHAEAVGAAGAPELEASLTK